MTGHSDGLKVATRIFRASLAVSIVGNAVGGYFGPSELDPVVTAGVHGLVPLFLAGAEMLLVKVASTGDVAADRFRVWTAGGVGLAAFAASAKNLAHLAEMSGFGEVMAWTFPAIVDLTMITAMVTVVWSAKAANTTPTKPVTKKPVTKRTTSTVSDRGVLEKPKPVSKPATTKPKVKRLDAAAVADALAVDPSATAAVLAERFGISKRTIQRTAAWKNRNNQNEKNEATAKNEEAINEIEIEEVAV